MDTPKKRALQKAKGGKKVGMEIRRDYNSSATERAHAGGDASATKSLHGERTPKKLQVKHPEYSPKHHIKFSTKRGITRSHGTAFSTY